MIVGGAVLTFCLPVSKSPKGGSIAQMYKNYYLIGCLHFQNPAQSLVSDSMHPSALSISSLVRTSDIVKKQHINEHDYAVNMCTYIVSTFFVTAEIGISPLNAKQLPLTP